MSIISTLAPVPQYIHQHPPIDFVKSLLEIYEQKDRLLGYPSPSIFKDFQHLQYVLMSAPPFGESVLVTSYLN